MHIRCYGNERGGRGLGSVLLLLAVVAAVGCGSGDQANRDADGTAVMVAHAQQFRALVERGDYAAARGMMSSDPRRWWNEREGEGSPWKLEPGGDPWDAWDDEFGSMHEIVTWRGGDRLATVVMRETNDYFRLLERGWVTNEVTYFFDDAGKIDGLLIRAIGKRPPGKTDDFLAWAHENDPDELDALMPGGEVDPSGDHPRRFRNLLNRWRAAEGMATIE